MILRDYQQRIFDDVRKALATNKSVLFQLPTGGGKTAILTELVASAVAVGMRVNVVVHRDELVAQVAASLVNRGLQPFAVTAKASRYVPREARVLVSMVQTLARRDVGSVDLLVIDEAHHAIADSYTNVIAKSDAKYIIGCTATPERLDGKGLHNVFETLVQGIEPHELTEQGWLVPVDIYACPPEYEPLEKRGGDFTAEAARAVMEASVINGDVISSWQEYANDMQTIAYATTIDLAERYAEEYRSVGVTAECLSSRTDARSRKYIMDKFRANELRVLINVAIVTEGVDVPTCECVQMLRPTASLALYLQMVGRVLRPAKNKHKAIIIDHAGNVQRLGHPAQPRRWSLDGARVREASELPPLYEVEDLPEFGNTKTDEIRHNKFVRLIPRFLASVDAVPARLRHLQSVAAGRVNAIAAANYAWREWRTEGNEPTLAIARAYAERFGLADDWATTQMVQHKFGA